MNIAFFISDHGYGHGTRTQALLELLWNIFSQQELKITLCSEKINLIIAHELSVHHYYANTFIIPTEYGMFVDPSGAVPDIYQSLTQLPEWVSKQLSLLDLLKKWLLQNNFDYVFTDISPFPLSAACEIGLPGIGISNFTWSDQYELLYNDVFSEKKHIHVGNKNQIYDAIEKITTAYTNATQAFKYPFSLAMRGFEHVPIENLPLIARKSQLDKDQAKLSILKNIFLSQHENTIPGSLQDYFLVYIGLGMSLIFKDTIKETFRAAPKNWYFIVPPTLRPLVKNYFSNVVVLPDGLTSTHDWIRGCDLVITKPGYSTVSEALLNEVPLAILDLNIPEAKLIKKSLLENGYAINVSLETLPESLSLYANKFESLKPARLPQKLSEQNISKLVDFITGI